MRLDGRVTEAQRHTWMDAMRGIAIFLVITLHASAILEIYGHQPPQFLAVFNDALSPYRMPALMFLSGLLLGRSLAKPAKTYVWGKVRKILWPFLLWTALWGAAGGIPFRWFEPGFWIDSTYLWYLEFLFVYYVVALVVRPILLSPRVSTWVHAALIVLPVAASALFPAESGWQRFFFLMGFFFAGSLFTYRLSAIERVLDARYAPLFLVGGAAVSVFSIVAGPIRYDAIWALPVAIGVLALCWVARRGGDARVATPLRAIGRDSIVYYVLHFPVIALLVRFGVERGYLSAAVASVLGIALALAVGFAAAWARRRSRAVRALFEFPDVLKVRRSIARA